MKDFDKLALTLLVLPNAYITFLWYFQDVIGINPGIDMLFAVSAGLALDFGAISLLSWKRNSMWKYVASIAFGVGSAIIAYYRYNNSFITFHGGHLLHTFYPLAALFYMLFLADATNSEAKKEEEEAKSNPGKEKCSKCGKWFKSGSGIRVHQYRCKK